MLAVVYAALYTGRGAHVLRMYTLLRISPHKRGITLSGSGSSLEELWPDCMVCLSGIKGCIESLGM